MYKGKTLIIGDRPWYRHPVFPWGVYSLRMDKIKVDKSVEVNGYYVKDGGGGGTFTPGGTKFDEEVIK